MFLSAPICTFVNNIPSSDLFTNRTRILILKRNKPTLLHEFICPVLLSMFISGSQILCPNCQKKKIQNEICISSELKRKLYTRCEELQFLYCHLCSSRWCFVIVLRVSTNSRQSTPVTCFNSVCVSAKLRKQKIPLMSRFDF